MAITWYVGQTYPSWDFPVMTDSGPDDLTGVTLSNLTLYFRQNGTDVAGTGTFSLKVTNPAEVLYKPSPADVASAFNGSIAVKGLYPPSNSSADEVCFDPIPFTIIAS